MNDSNSLPKREANAADFSPISNKNSYVTKYTRGGKNGKQLVCPECDNIIRIYHFSFSGLTCPQCKQSVAKYDWKVRTIQDKLGTDSSNKIDEITDVFDNLEKENDSLISLLKEVN